ncbi:unnamed protein product, partial [Angiostrongylus costaricensis]|uniref:CW-type domain-containing protein n=1 Tax=Angiostrongylus costaricensis TaxID=334426 RepID=A0A0R3Q1Z8_ANGCS
RDDVRGFRVYIGNFQNLAFLHSNSFGNYSPKLIMQWLEEPCTCTWDRSRRPWPTKPSIPPGSENWYQTCLGVSESASGPPEFTEARVSRIPKRTDSVKTPIIERKLPSLPKSVTQRSHSAEDKVRSFIKGKGKGGDNSSPNATPKNISQPR